MRGVGEQKNWKLDEPLCFVLFFLVGGDCVRERERERERERPLGPRIGFSWKSNTDCINGACFLFIHRIIPLTMSWHVEREW